MGDKLTPAQELGRVADELTDTLRRAEKVLIEQGYTEPAYIHLDDGYRFGCDVALDGRW